MELSAFLSYVEPTELDFDGLAAVALVGENGHGKSSIPEAIGWALFGRGRYSSPDAYVSHGQTECRVSFEFELDHHTYRVERQRTLSGGGKSYLGLFAHRPAGQWGEEPWYPIGGDHIREVQAAIENLLGLTYDMWLSTSFVGQGKADAFTRLPAGERKALLGEVLQLGLYEALCQRAKEHERDLGVEHQALLRRGEELEDLLATEDPDRLKHARAAQFGAQASVGSLESDHAHAVEVYERARGEAEEAQRARYRLLELQERRAAQAANLESDLDRIRADRDRTNAELANLGVALSKLQASASLEPEYTREASERRTRAEAAEAQAEGLRHQSAERRAAAAAALERVAAAGEHMRETRERIALLTRKGSGAKCWACQQDLSPDKRAALFTDLEQANAEATVDAEQERALATTEQEAAADALAQAAERVKRAATLRAQAESYDRAATKARADAERIPHDQERLSLLESRIREIDATAAEASRLLAGLQEPPAEETDLQAVVEGAGERERRAAVAADRVAYLLGELVSARKRLNEATAELGRAEEQASTFDRARADLERVYREIEETGRLRFGYGVLVLAFGKDGVPALRVENALPQIEEEANRLLNRLTEGRFTVQLESLRATKAGTTRETLDIMVLDQANGTETPLEGLSGGERQAVDLALRIGLARLLSHRAGRQIEALIADEPFGAFDTAHLQRAIGLLHALTDEFPLVLLITHLRELAEAFPTRLEVVREDGTSRVRTAELVGEAA